MVVVRGKNSSEGPRQISSGLTREEKKGVPQCAAAS